MAPSGNHKILITRNLTDVQLSVAQSLGLSVTVRESIDITFRNDWLSVQGAIEKADPALFVFTSQNAVKAVSQFMKAGVDIPPEAPVFAVGSKTEEALNDLGFSKINVPHEKNGAGLAHLIADHILNNEHLATATVLHFCGDKRRDELSHFLKESDISIKDIVVYQTRLKQMDLPDLSQFEAILFYSPSSVQAFRQSGGFRIAADLPELFAIGPTTGEELSIESGRHVHISPQPDTAVFLDFVARMLGEGNVKGET